MKPLFADTALDRLLTGESLAYMFCVWAAGALIAVIWTRRRMQWQEAQYAARAGHLTAEQETARQHALAVEDQLVNGILSWIAVIQLGWSTPYWHEKVFPQ